MKEIVHDQIHRIANGGDWIRGKIWGSCSKEVKVNVLHLPTRLGEYSPRRRAVAPVLGADVNVVRFRWNYGFDFDEEKKGEKLTKGK